MESSDHFEYSLSVHESLKPRIREFNLVSERTTVLRIITTRSNILLICIHVPSEEKLDHVIPSMKTLTEFMTKHQEK